MFDSVCFRSNHDCTLDDESTSNHNYVATANGLWTPSRNAKYYTEDSEESNVTR